MPKHKLIREENASGAVYPKAEIQQHIIHQIHNITEALSYKDIKALITDSLYSPISLIAFL